MAHLNTSKVTRLVLSGMLLGVAAAADRGQRGRLRSFESQTAAPSPLRSASSAPRARKGDSGRHSEASTTDELLVELFVRPLLIGVAVGGAYGMELSGNREVGDPIFPLVRVDAGVQTVNSDITAYGYGLEVGQAIIAGEFRHTHYRDRLFDDTLNFYQAHALYRMGAGPRVEMSLALGGMWLRGEQENSSALSAGLPVRYWPSRRVGVEVRPMFGFFEFGTLNDIEGGLLFRYRNGSIRAGYRWVESGGEKLSGPRIGFSLRF